MQELVGMKVKQANRLMGHFSQRGPVCGNGIDNDRRWQATEASRWSRVTLGYIRSGRLVGSYTVCARFKYMRPSDVEYFLRYNGFDRLAEWF